MTHQYTVDQKLAGLDLHGLPCRIPEPVGKQKDCTHTQHEKADWGEGYFDDNDEWVVLYTWAEVTTMRDIPSTNNLKCTLCGYTRRY